VSSAQHDSGSASYGLRFLNLPDVVRQMDPFYRRWLNRRRHVRVMPDLGSRPTAVLSWKEGDLHGRIHDISLGGLGIATSLNGAGRLEQDARVEVTFSLPGGVLPITCSARVVVVRAFKTAALIGLAFDPTGGIAVHALAIQRYVEERQKDIARWNDVMARLKSPQ
jgi:c-di-GMP-binding flagellar brake protein YcgR